MTIRSSINYRYKNRIIHPFSNVLVCGSYIGSMTYRWKYEGYKYKCANIHMGGKRCTAHSIKEKVNSENLKKFHKTKRTT